MTMALQFSNLCLLLTIASNNICKYAVQMKYTCNDDIANNQHTIAIKLLCLFTEQSLQST